jgi:hypothetical protein
VVVGVELEVGAVLMRNVSIFIISVWQVIQKYHLHLNGIITIIIACICTIVVKDRLVVQYTHAN